MSGLCRGENEIHIYGLRMYELMKEKTGRDKDDKYIDNFICYMLNRAEWLKMCSKWILVSHKFEKKISKGENTLRFVPSYIARLVSEDSSNWYTEIFINQFWLKKTNRNKYNQFLFSICHELVHHFEYIDSYYEQKRVDYIQADQEELLGEYINAYQNTYPRDKKRFKNLMKQKKFILKPEPFFLK